LAASFGRRRQDQIGSGDCRNFDLQIDAIDERAGEPRLVFGARLQAKPGSLERPHLHCRVAFLPWTPVTLRSLKPKDFRENPRTLGECLKKRRLEQGLLQRQTAAQIGVSVDTYRRWEMDQVAPYAPAWRRIISFLGYDPGPPPQTLGEQLRNRRRVLG